MCLEVGLLLVAPPVGVYALGAGTTQSWAGRVTAQRALVHRVGRRVGGGDWGLVRMLLGGGGGGGRAGGTG